MGVQDRFEVSVVNDPKVLASTSNGGQPYLKIEFPNGVVVNISSRVARCLRAIGYSVRREHESEFGEGSAGE